MCWQTCIGLGSTTNGRVTVPSKQWINLVNVWPWPMATKKKLRWIERKKENNNLSAQAQLGMVVKQKHRKQIHKDKYKCKYKYKSQTGLQRWVRMVRWSCVSDWSVIWLPHRSPPPHNTLMKQKQMLRQSLQQPVIVSLLTEKRHGEFRVFPS